MKRIVIDDISCIKLNGNNFGHYDKVAVMYKKMLKSIDVDVMIAGGAVYSSKTVESERIALAKSKFRIFLIKIGSVIKGISLFSKLNDDIMIFQPYSFPSRMISILFAKRITDIYLIVDY